MIRSLTLIKVHNVQEVYGVFVIFLCFATETSDYVSAQTDIGYDTSDGMDQINISLTGVTATHSFKDSGAARLGRHMDMIGNIAPFSDEV